MDRYLHAARWLPLGIDPFVSLTAVMYVGMEIEYDKAPVMDDM